jgi:lipoyl(octanoyl) transferase
MHLLQVLQLGVVDYSTALKLQRTLVSLRKQGRIADTMLLLEHPAVITLGRNSKTSNILASPESLARRGVEVHETDRGGDVTLHAPGQLVGYPICDLRGFTPKVGAVDFVRRLEETLIRCCADFGIATERVAGCTGVWTQAASSDPTCAADRRKIAAIGVHISRGVTSHGFALNVSTDLDLFKLIIPCGIADKPVTSMAAELGQHKEKPPTMEAVSQSLTRQFGNVFGTQILWLESLDSLLSRAAESDQNEKVSPSQDTPLREPDDLRRMRDELDIAPRDDIHWA